MQSDIHFEKKKGGDVGMHANSGMQNTDVPWRGGREGGRGETGNKYYTNPA